MTLLRVDTTSPTPPYEQLRTQIAGLVAAGELTAGQKLPTVRQLAGDLGIAPNTVARAYRELEADGVLSTQGRRGTFVTSELLDVQAPESEPTAAAAAFARVARRHGFTLAEAQRLMERAWHV